MEDDFAESVETDKNRNKWTKNMTMLLISLFAEHQVKFSEINFPRKKIWKTIASVLQESGFHVTGLQCDEKWRNLKKTYMKVKNSAARTGTGSLRWQYFEVMDNLLRDQFNVETATAIEASDLAMTGAPTFTQGDIIYNLVADPSRSLDGSGKVIAKPCTFTSEAEPTWFKKYLRERRESRAEKERRHKEKMDFRKRELKSREDFQEKLLEALKNLAD